jgi:hypothetical protein
VNADRAPIDISPGFESVLAPIAEPADTDPQSVPVRRHRKLQAEPRDEPWASHTESDIRAHVQEEVVAHGGDPHRLELVVVECRTSGCERQAIGYPEDNLKEGRDLQLILPKMMRDAMPADFDARSHMIMLTSLPDGRIGYIAFLPRKMP